MRMTVLAKRCAKEILRDPINLGFGLGFPLILLGLMSAIQANIPVRMFEIERLAPGIAVFGLSFMTLFSATLISKDRESAFLQRLYASPLTAADFLGGYMLPVLLIAAGQTAVCLMFSLTLGLKASVGMVLMGIGCLPAAAFHVALGLLLGSVLGVKQVGGICGALLTNLSGWMSGVWFDLELVGEGFGRVARMLPYYHAVKLAEAMLGGRFEAAAQHLLPVMGYCAVTGVIAGVVFWRQMKRRQ